MGGHTYLRMHAELWKQRALPAPVQVLMLDTYISRAHEYAPIRRSRAGEEEKKKHVEQSRREGRKEGRKGKKNNYKCFSPV